MIALRADEMAGSGFILEQIRMAIQQSRICVADLTGSNPNVLYEVGYAQAIRKPMVLLASENAQLPFDLAHQRVVIYGDDTENTRQKMSAAILLALSDERLEEAVRLFELGEYRAAIAAASVVLEHRLRQLLAKRLHADSGQVTLGRLAQIAQRSRVLPSDLRPNLTEVVKLRNEAVHGRSQPTRKSAQLVLTTVRRLLDEVELPSKAVVSPV